jgi:hypothetical protein
MKKSPDAPDILNATGDFERHVVRSGRVPPLQPKNWFLDTKGNGIVVRVVNRGTLGTDSAISGAVRYDVHWAETVDTTTSDGIEAGFRRSKVIATVPALDIEDMESESGVIDDETYQSGYFYVVARSAENDRSVIGQPKRLSNQILSTSIPGAVEHFQVTESGEMHNGTVWSALSVSFRAPRPLAGFAGVQLVLEHYPGLNDPPTYWVSKRYSGLGGGAGQFKELAQVCRRIGTGTISVTIGATGITGVGTAFTQQMRAGDYLEIGGTRAQIASVTDDDTATLSANWAGNRPYAAFASWEVIGLVRVYARSLSDGDVGAADLSTLPYVDVLMDGELSAPNAPTITGTSRGNATVITWEQVVGTQIKGYRIYRGGAAGTAFVDCEAVGWIDQTKDVTAAASLLEWTDTNFTLYQRSVGQVFAYYAVTVNERDDVSAPSVGINVAARLDSSGENAPGAGGPNGVLNLLWNGMLYGTVGNPVATGDASQDDLMGGVAPSGAHDYWDGTSAGGTVPGHRTETEVIMPFPGGVGNWTQLKQLIGAWDNQTAANRMIERGRNITLQAAARASSPTSPEGELTVILAMMGEVSGTGTDRGYYRIKERDTDDSFIYTEQIRGGSTYGHTWELASLLGQDYSLLYVTFSPQVLPTKKTITAATNAAPIVITSTAHGFVNGDLIVVSGVAGNTAANGIWTVANKTADTFELAGSTGSGVFSGTDGRAAYAITKIELRLTHWDSNNGNNLYLSRPMLSYGDGIPAWTAEMPSSTITTTPPTGSIDPPGGYPIDDGSRTGIIDIQNP